MQLAAWTGSPVTSSVGVYPASTGALDQNWAGTKTSIRRGISASSQMLHVLSLFLEVRTVIPPRKCKRSEIRPIHFPSTT